MTYEFKTADGRICCSSDKLANLCTSCKARAAGQTPPDYSGRGTPRTAEFAPPDPYAPRTTAMCDGERELLGPYAEGIAKLREVH